jgi:hemerythrin-like domain-containing protein
MGTWPPYGADPWVVGVMWGHCGFTRSSDQRTIERMTNTTNPPNTELTDMHDMVVVHRVFRRELSLIPDLLLSTPAGDVERASIVVGHARLILSGLHLHHTSEDDLLWPLLVQRSGPSTELVERMQAQHAEVDQGLDRLETVLARWETEVRPAVAREAARVMNQLRQIVVEHLDDEEEHILPVAEASITPQEWASVGKAGVAKMTRAELPLMFGALLEDASEAERRQMLKSLPVPIRCLMRTWGSVHYRRYITKVRGLR